MTDAIYYDITLVIVLVMVALFVEALKDGHAKSGHHAPPLAVTGMDG